jgi:alkylation response protein AidB-like acyl-CoA dehydrogenase
MSPTMFEIDRSLEQSVTAGGTRPNSAETLLSELRTRAPRMAARAAEIESGRRLPLDLVEELRSLGIFRMFVPVSHGGLELDVPTALEIFSALSRIDGSLGWTATIGSTASLFLSWLPRQTYDKIYEHGPDIIVAGTAQPGGSATPTSGGYIVSGRWPFASGCQHADWMVGFCIVKADNSDTRSSESPPMVRGFVMPATSWSIEDTWLVSGLKGTGSHHISLLEAFVPSSYFFDLENGAACLSGPLYQAIKQLLPLSHGAVSIGIAEGALDDIVALANTGRQQLRAPTPMRDSELFQVGVGRAEAELRATQAFLRAQSVSHWQKAQAGTLKTEELLLEGMQAAVWIAASAVHTVEACFLLGGGAALYETSPLQRRLRDLQAAAQHAVAHQRHYAAVGKMLLQRDLSLTERSQTSPPA